LIQQVFAVASVVQIRGTEGKNPMRRIWPAVGIGIVIASFIAGFGMTGYSQQFW
jgi:xanthine/uracil permease